MFLYLLCYCVSLSSSTIVNEIIEGSINVEHINPLFVFSIDFTSTVNITEYVLYQPTNETNRMGLLSCYIMKNNDQIPISIKMGKIDPFRTELILTFQETTSDVIHCQESLVQFIQPYGKTKQYDDEYLFMFSKNLCPLTQYQTNICIMDINCLQSQRLYYDDHYKIINTTNSNMIRYVREDFKSLSYQYFYIIFKSSIDPIVVDHVTKDIIISNDNIQLTDNYYNIMNLGQELATSFERYYYTKHINDTIACKSFSFFFPNTTNDIKCFDSTGLIHSYKIKNSSQLIQLELTPRYPLFGGWKTSFSFMRTNPFDLYKNGNEQQLLIPLLTKTMLIGIKKMNITVTFPIGYTILNYQSTTLPFGLEMNLQTQQHLLFYQKQTLCISLNNVSPQYEQVNLMVTYREDDTTIPSAIILTIIIMTITMIIFFEIWMTFN
ncbi:Dolichyl-diphosphooligosaccharide--protein glycosyltransferase subunit 1 [Entamoeba marina]